MQDFANSLIAQVTNVNLWQNGENIGNFITPLIMFTFVIGFVRALIKMFQAGHKRDPDDY